MYFPPAMETKPGAGRSTVCSRESFVVVALFIFATNGRKPAYTPIISSAINFGSRTRFA